MKKTYILLFTLSVFQHLTAQSFYIRNAQDIFQPNIALRTSFLPKVNVKETDELTFAYQQYQLQATIPIAGNIDVDFEWDKLKNFDKIKSLKDFKNIKKTIPVNLSGYQLFWTLGGSLRTVSINEDGKAHQLFQINTSILGAHLLPKSRLLFYNVAAKIEEDTQTFKQLHPSFDIIFGQVHLQTPKFVYFYGAFLSYANGRILPAPFLGAYFDLPNHFSAQILLPAQLQLTYKPHKNWRTHLALNIEGVNSGFENRRTNFLLTEISNEATERLAFNYFIPKTTVGIQFQKGKFRWMTEAGYVFASRLTLRNEEVTQTLKPKNAFFANVLMQVTISKRSLLGSIIDKLRLNF